MQDHAEKLQSLVNDALDKGAEIAGRGRFGNLGTDAVDQFFPPTVIVNVNHSMQIMQEEVIFIDGYKSGSGLKLKTSYQCNY